MVAPTSPLPSHVMGSHWGFPHAAAIIAGLVLAAGAIADRRAARRRRQQRHPESYTSRFRRRQELASQRRPHTTVADHR
jgi:hypothetical protein